MKRRIDYVSVYIEGHQVLLSPEEYDIHIREQQKESKANIMLCVKGTAALVMTEVEGRRFSHAKLIDTNVIKHHTTVYAANTRENRHKAMDWFGESNGHRAERDGPFPVGSLLFWNEG